MNASEIKPWYRRASEWVSDAHKVVTTIAVICTGTIAAHAYLAKVVTQDNLKTEVRQAVVEAMLETKGDVSDLKDHTAGLPEWRRTTQEMVTRHDERINTLEKTTDKIETRLDHIRR